MKWSWKIGRFAGIDVYMHTTFLLLLGWLGLSYWLQGRTVTAVLSGVGFILALFLCVVLHEYGHALTARRYGIQTRDITLLPIGGVARLERMPDQPVQELWVALAGPAVNVVIAAILLPIVLLSGGFSQLSSLSVTQGGFVERLMLINITLVLFNLIPAFPMDGGRVLRALLAMRMDYMRATQLAAGLGQAIAFVFGFIGLFSNPFLLFIAFFVYIGAAQESSMAQMKSALGGIPVSRSMVTNFETLAPEDSLRRAVALVLSGTQQDFPVVSDGQVVGVLTRSALLSALSREGQDASVAETMDRDFQLVDSYDMLDSAMARLQTCDCHTLPVQHNGSLVGLLTMDNVGEFLMIQSAIKRPRSNGGRDAQKSLPQANRPGDDPGIT